MSLSSKSIQAMFQAHFSAENRFILTTEQIPAFTSQLHSQLVGLPFVEIDPQNATTCAENEQHLLSFYLQDLPLSGDSYAYYSNNNFTLKLTADNELAIANRQTETTIASLDELMAFIADGQNRMEQRVAQANKNQKLHKLRHSAIIAHIKRLAQDEKFDYAYETEAKNLRLYVRLSDNQLAELLLPYHGFETVLPNLRAAITSLRKLHEQGIGYKVISAENKHLRIEWQTYSTP